jgi:hypothetical protein
MTTLTVLGKVRGSQANPIYTVTTILFGKKELTVGPNKGKKIFAILDERVVGWFEKKKDAKQCIEENWGDIYEGGSYPYAVIEECGEGLYPICLKSWWFRWRDKGYKHSRKPKSYKHVINFGIG